MAVDYIKKSLKVLERLQLKNGGIIATLKSDCYPFIYPRDSAIICDAFNSMGKHERSIKFYYFLKDCVGDRKEIYQRYSADGLPLVSKKHEHDNPGLVLNGIWNTYRASEDMEFLKDMWRMVLNAVNRVEKYMRNGLIYTERSIHEFFRLENGYEIWANCANCKGLYAAGKIAETLGERKLSKKFISMSEELKRNILSNFYDKKSGIFAKTIKLNGNRLFNADITQLSPFYFGLYNDKKMLESMVKFIENNLWYKELGGFMRFKKFEFVKDWHWYTGGHGAFPQFTLWMAKFYNELNNDKKCSKCVEWVEKIFTEEGYLPEHISLQKEYEEWKKNEYEFSERILLGIKRSESLKTRLKGVRYWATPLGWANAEYILLAPKIKC